MDVAAALVQIAYAQRRREPVPARGPRDAFDDVHVSVEDEQPVTAIRLHGVDVIPVNEREPLSVG